MRGEEKVKKIINLTKVLCLMLVTALVLTGCGTGGSGSASGEKVLKVGIDPTFAPFVFLDEQNRHTGYDVDLIKALGEEMGYDVEITTSSWEGLIPGIEVGKFDAIIGAITITDERKGSIDFSDPYYTVNQLIAAKKGSGIKSVGDLKNKAVGVQMGTTGEFSVEELGVTPNKYEGIPEAFTSLLNGTIDSVVADAPVVQYFLKQNPSADLEYVVGDFPKEYYGIGIKKGNTKLLDDLNAALKALIENGKYNEIHEKWFNVKAPALD